MLVTSVETTEAAAAAAAVGSVSSQQTAVPAAGKTTLKINEVLLGGQNRPQHDDLALMGLSGSGFLMNLKRELQLRTQNRDKLRAERQQLLEGSVDISSFFDSPRPPKFIGSVEAENALVRDLLKKTHVVAALNDGSIKLEGYEAEFAAALGSGWADSTTTEIATTRLSNVKSPLPRWVAAWVNRHTRAALITALVLIILGLFQLIVGLAIAISGGVEVIPLPAAMVASPSSSTTELNSKNSNNPAGTPTVTLTSGITGGSGSIIGAYTGTSSTNNSATTATSGPSALTQSATFLQATANAIIGAQATQTALVVNQVNNKGKNTLTANIPPTPAASISISMISPTAGNNQEAGGSPNATAATTTAVSDPTLQHAGFMPPSQLVAPAFQFSSNHIDPARAVGSQAPIAVPPKGTIYHFGAYGGEAGNCILVGDYETIGKALIEQVQQNDLVSVVDRFGDVYTYRVTNYQVATDLMRNTLPQTPSAATSTTIMNGTLVVATPTVSSVLQGYAQDSVLFQTNKTDLNLLSIPTNSRLAVLTLVSTARPGDNPDERLAVRGVLVAFKLAQPAPAGTPVAVGVATTVNTTPTAYLSTAVATTPQPITAGTTANSK